MPGEAKREATVATLMWEPVREQYCERVECQVALEAELIYPAEMMPDQPPRVTAHRCSLGMVCNLFDKPTCCWAGTQPGYDPLA
jgi:hypothetical protein